MKGRIIDYQLTILRFAKHSPSAGLINAFRSAELILGIRIPFVVDLISNIELRSGFCVPIPTAFESGEKPFPWMTKSKLPSSASLQAN